MVLHEIIQIKGCITQEKYLKGRSLSEIERILGFHAGRLKSGMTVAALQQIPQNNQFELLGYTQVAEHRHKPINPKELDVNKLKEIVRTTVFSLSGPNKLVKVIPGVSHNPTLGDDEQYPSGEGVPQWKITTPLQAKVIVKVLPGERYI